ncbi:MAG: phosphoribosylamine--glycine ligase [Candidatus Saccharimonadales bacterium]
MVVDSGARGQALGMKLAHEGEAIFISPGNPGNEDFAVSTNLIPSDISGQLAFARQNKVDFTIVGGEDLLAAGIVDNFNQAKLAIFGPTRAQARIEADREFAKEIGHRHSVPMGAFGSFMGKTTAIEYAENHGWPVFVKDNGLAGGKGASKCETPKEVEAEIARLGGKIIIEDYVGGLEASHHAFCDGKSQLSIPFLVRDHKQIGDGNRGPMTGGMGVVGPLPEYSSRDSEEFGETFAAPVVQELGFKGMLFSGLKGNKGHEKLLEWNARPGDPETQVFLALMKGKLLPVLQACVEGSLDKIEPPDWWLGQSAVSLVLAAQGYPEKPQTGAIIEGIEEAEKTKNIQILYAATKKQGSQLVTNGGRVLNILATAESLSAALTQAYSAAEHITFNGQPPTFRRDIGHSVVSGL